MSLASALKGFIPGSNVFGNRWFDRQKPWISFELSCLETLLQDCKVRPQVLIHSGNNFDFVDLDRNIFTIEDIAHGLSNVCRFGGQCNRFYSVAQHSVMVSYLVPAELSMAALLHDAAEAFMGDITSPLKSLLPDYRTLEKKVESMILARFGIVEPLDMRIKLADRIALATEERDLMPRHADSWELLRGVLPIQGRIRPVSSRKAYRQFMSRYKEISESNLKQGSLLKAAA
ncbi:MAG: hypothetical protein HPY59_07440 [Anaerolineae bacterium]|nr:hypothetical protein [Anaerolineae bacterium]